MKIIRAGFQDTDIFDKEKLNCGACCFFTEDKACRYFFEIKGKVATLYANTENHISQAIDEFLFYSGFIVTVKDAQGRVLVTRTPNEPYLHEIAKIQPSQFYVNQEKLDSCKTWIRSHEDIIIPILLKDDQCISLDGHTRLKAALDLGYTAVYVYPQEYDATIFHFVDEAIRRGIRSASDMEVVSDEEYKLKWDQFCDDLFASLP